MVKSAARPLWRLEDLLALSFQPDELYRSLSRWFPPLVPELPPTQESAAHFSHEAVALLERHGSIDARFFAHLLTARPLRRAQIVSAAFALSVDTGVLERLVEDGQNTHVFRSAMIVEPKLVDALEGLVLERERASPDDPRRSALSEDIERLAAQIRTRRPVSGGERVAGTILEYLIGRGTFGSVWRSRDVETGASRATKIFDVNRLTDGVMLWRFRRSIRALQTLNKYRGAPTSIAKVYEVAEDGLAFSMEYLPRGSLEMVAQRSWTLDGRLRVFSEICQAVTFAHRAGVIHRDIKPTNVMFDATLRPVLIDFDIADVQFLTEQQLTCGGLGTPMFAAPEQIECAGEVDERADVYSLGRLLHYILIERMPSYAEQEGLLENLSRFPPSLSYTVRKATQRKPGNRFRDVDSLRREVEAYKTGLSAVHANIRRSVHWVGRNAVAVVMASSVTAGALLYAKHQEVLAAHGLERQRVAEATTADYEKFAATLSVIDGKLTAAREVQEGLKALLNDARATLAKLERGEVIGDGKALKVKRQELRAEIDRLEAELEQAELKLNSVHDEFRRTLKENNRKRGQETPQDVPVAAPKPPVQPAEAEAAAATPDEPNPVKDGAKRKLSPPRITRTFVNGSGRYKEFMEYNGRWQSAGIRCWKGEAASATKVGFKVYIHPNGKVAKITKQYGEIPHQARKCIEKLLRRRTFAPMKAGSKVSQHPIEFGAG
jgi:serine/threonine protein kinase